MEKIIHKISYYRKKLGLTLAMVMLMGSFVYAQNAQKPNDVFAASNRDAKIVKFYPSPATSIINFEFSNEIGKNYILQVYSFTGKKMIETPVSANKMTLTLNSDFYRGIYIIRLCDKSGKVLETSKFQVIR